MNAHEFLNDLGSPSSCLLPEALALGRVPLARGNRSIFFVSFDYWPLLLSKTVEKGSWKQALVDDKAFSVLHWEDSEQNADDFRLLPASLQETDLQG